MSEDDFSWATVVCETCGQSFNIDECFSYSTQDWEDTLFSQDILSMPCDHEQVIEEEETGTDEN